MRNLSGRMLYLVKRNSLESLNLKMLRLRRLGEELSNKARNFFINNNSRSITTFKLPAIKLLEERDP